jgi:5-methylcytosine-specific restriction endonuclease McrA
VSPLLKICSCGALTPTTPCPACKAAKGRRHRAMPTWQTYNTPRWKKLRLRILQRDDHTCARCGGPANTAGHLQPFTDKDDPLAWDEGICRTSARAATRGSGRPVVRGR